MIRKSLHHKKDKTFTLLGYTIDKLKSHLEKVLALNNYK